MKGAQARNIAKSLIIVWIQAGKGENKLADKDMETICLVHQWDQLEIANGVLCSWKSKGNIKRDSCQILVPHKL